MPRLESPQKQETDDRWATSAQPSCLAAPLLVGDWDTVELSAGLTRPV